MASIHGRWAALIHSLSSPTSSSVPPEFLAALIANESAGMPDVRRLEPFVFALLKRVREGELERYYSIRQVDLLGFSDDELKLYASSLGLTQIMGYQVLFRRLSPIVLLSPGENLNTALSLLAGFAHRFGLQPRRDFGELFRCWNTGQPYGKTHDSEYIAKGLERMKIYQALMALELSA